MKKMKKKMVKNIDLGVLTSEIDQVSLPLCLVRVVFLFLLHKGNLKMEISVILFDFYIRSITPFYFGKKKIFI